jgi:hypothetical protein
MTHSLCLMAATLLAGQIPDGRLTAVPAGAEIVMPSNPGCNCQRGAAQMQMATPMPAESRGLFPHLRERLRDLFGNEPESAPLPVRYEGPIQQGRVVPMPAAAIEEQEPPIAQAEPPLADGPRKLPVGKATPLADLAPQSATGPARVLMSGDPLGHDEEYHNVTGRLELQPANGGTWVVRYGNRDDRYRGVLALSTVEDMNQFHAGDLVYVQGEILDARPAAGVGLPIFRAQSIVKVELAP